MKTAISIHAADRQAWSVAKFILLGLFAIALSGFATSGRAIELDYAVFGDGDGAIYVVNANGDLRWYRHNGKLDGTFS